MCKRFVSSQWTVYALLEKGFIPREGNLGFVRLLQTSQNNKPRDVTSGISPSCGTVMTQFLQCYLISGYFRKETQNTSLPARILQCQFVDRPNKYLQVRHT